MARNRNYPMAAVEAMPERVFVEIYNRATDGTTELRKQTGPDPVVWRLDHLGRSWRFPRAKDALRITHIGERPERRVRDQYTLGGAFAPDPDDMVVDVGSFIGELAVQLHDVDLCHDIVAVEPDPRNAVCLDYNVPDAVQVERVGAYSENSDLTFHMARDGSESGVLRPDKGQSQEIQVPMRRLDSLLEREPDWLKVEAEGNEPEVLEGLGEYRPRQIVVSVSAERDGLSPAEWCRSHLRERGYDTAQRGEYLFAALDGLELGD